MIRGKLTEDAMDELEGELSRFELMSDYLEKTGQKDETFRSLRQAENLKLADGAISINDIILIENSKGKMEILKTTKTEYSKREIEEISKKTGLKEEDIILLLHEGMKKEDILKEAEQIPKGIKDISESAAIREMIKQNIKLKPEVLTEMKKKGIQIVPMKDGSLQIKSLQKLAEVNEKGLLQFEPQLSDSLKPFEEVGLIRRYSDLVIKELEPQPQEKRKGNSLRVVSLKEKEAEQKRDEIEKQKMARDLNIDSSEIVSVIRIDDKENGSKLLNDARVIGDDTPIYIIRTRNGITSNKFITAKGTKNGGYEQIQGFESTPVSKQVATLLKDTQNSMDTVAIKPGEIRAGKMHPMDDEYRYFLIRRAGESKDDDSNTLLYVGTSGETDISLIENRENGERQFVQLPVSRVHPSSIYLENNRGYGEKTELSTQINDKDDKGTIKPEITFEDINEKKRLLEKLEKIESKIVEIEDRRETEPVESYSPEETNTEVNSETSSREMEAESNELDALYAERSKIIKQLGLEESKVIQEPEEEISMEHRIRKGQ